MQYTHKLAFTLLASIILSACNNDNDTTTNYDTTTISGKVADGYLVGAKVCLDSNKNHRCDSNEASTMTMAGGTYNLSASQSDLLNYPLVVEVPIDAIDEDDNKPVGQAYNLSAPAGKHDFISPLTTLVYEEMVTDASLTSNIAADKIKAELGLTDRVDLFTDFIHAKSTSINDTDMQNAYEIAHRSAKVLVNTLQTNQMILGQTTNIAATQSMLVKHAKIALKSQGTEPDPDKLIGIENKATLMAMLISQNSPKENATQSIEIQFDLQNNGNTVRCGEAITINDANESDTTGKLSDTRFYISNLLLKDDSGHYQLVHLTENDYQSKGVALLDFGYNLASSGIECSTTYNTKLVGHVPPGTYNGITMTLGVPVLSTDGQTRLNHSNQSDPETPAALTKTGMSWSWQGGRKFTKIEFNPDSPVTLPKDKTSSKWNVHIGSTGCSGNPTTGSETACTNANRLNLTFDHFNSQNNTIALDIQQLFANTDLSKDTGGAAGCMSGTTDPECIGIFKALGLGLTGAKAGQTLEGDNVQTVFSVK